MQQHMASGKRMQGIYRTLKSIYDNVGTVLYTIIICCVILQIFARYVITVPIPWTEELSRYLLVICAFTGSVIAFRTGGHLGAYFLRDMAKGRLRGFFYAVSSLVILFTMILLFVGALKMRSGVVGLDSATMRWFMQSWLYDAALLGYGLMFCYTVRDLYFSILVMFGKREITSEGKNCPFPEDT